MVVEEVIPIHVGRAQSVALSPVFSRLSRAGANLSKLEDALPSGWNGK